MFRLLCYCAGATIKLFPPLTFVPFADVCFQPFFNFVDMRALLENFCVYHVNAPGQEEGAPSLPDE